MDSSFPLLFRSPVKALIADPTFRLLAVLHTDFSASVQHLQKYSAPPLVVECTNAIGFLSCLATDQSSDPPVVISFLNQVGFVDLTAWIFSERETWCQVELALESSGHSNAAKQPRLRLPFSQSCSSSTMSFFSNHFVIANVDAQKVVVFGATPISGDSYSLRICCERILSTDSLFGLPLTCISLIPHYLLFGTVGGVCVLTLEQNESSCKILDNVPSRNFVRFTNPGKDCNSAAITKITVVHGGVILMADSCGNLFATDVSAAPDKRRIVQLQLTFAKSNEVVDFTLLPKPATRSESVPVSGKIVVLVGKHSVHFASLKNVLKFLECCTTSAAELRLCSDKVHVSVGEIVQVQAIPPDCLFFCCTNEVDVYVLNNG